MKAISGEDSIDVPRKNTTEWSGKLGARIVVIGQRIPNWADDSDALGARLVILRFTRSFEGKEKTWLSDQLTLELPGIFLWAMDGLWRLRQNTGHFTMPESAIADRHTAERLASPVRAFVEDHCKVDVRAWITEDGLHHAYKEWCEANGRHAHAKTEFVESLMQARPGAIEKWRPTDITTIDPAWKATDKRPRCLKGIRLLKPGEHEPEPELGLVGGVQAVQSRPVDG
jgi:putative DNA primase/helicase